MKRITTTLAAALFFGLASAQPNGDFEIWKFDTLSLSPDSWHTSNGLVFLGTPPVERTNDKTEGNFAVRLETQSDLVSGIVPGAISNVPAEDLQNFPSIPGGWAFSAQPDSFYFDAKFTMMPGDSGIVAVFFKKNGNIIGPNYRYMQGTQSTWTTIGMDLSPMPFAPDTVVIIFTSSNLLQPSSMEAGSTLWVDNMRFGGGTGVSNIMNPGVESWTASTYDHPEGWNSPDLFVTALTGVKTTSRDTDFHTSAFAVRLETKTTQFDDTIPGILVSGDIFFEEATGGFPFTGPAKKLMGYYKYTPVGNDSAAIGVRFSKNAVITGEFLKNFPAASVYTLFEVPVTLSVTPDSAMIFLSSSRATIDTNDAEEYIPGSVLLVDDVRLNNWNLTTPEFNPHIRAFGILPNPARGRAFLHIESAETADLTYQIVDVSGKEVKVSKQVTLNGSVQQFELDLTGLTTGVYFVRLQSGAFNKALRMVVE